MPKPRSRRQMVGPSSAPSSDSVIKILISTDNHLGYLEKDPVRGEDSFRAFEEVLHIAKANEVDMLLLGGDLFHDNKPSRSTLMKTMRLLRQSCLSPDGAVRLAVRSDPSPINYMNPSVAVSLPVFVIHGNHDDPTGVTGPGALSALDLLAEAGLVTYFGKMSNSKRVEVSPILLQKGRTALALYGIGNIRDEVLYQTWAKERNVKWLSPMENPANRDRERHLPDTDTGDDSDLRWFSLLVLHQNRVMRGTAKGISETLLPPWLDYVLWGHEHDSIPELTLTSPPIVQPGSTVATSLSAGESKPKHAVLLEVYRGKLKHRSVPLQTVRNFRFVNLSLSEQIESGVRESDSASITTFLEQTVHDLTAELETEFDEKLALFRNTAFKQTSNGIRYPPSEFYIRKLSPLVRQPLIRIRVEISGNWDVPNPQRFGQNFLGTVASASEILLYYRSKKYLKKTQTLMAGYSGTGGNEIGVEEDEEGMLLSQNGTETRDIVQIPKLVQYYLYHSRAGGAGLKFLELDGLTRSVDEFVNKEETKAISDYVSSYLKVQQSKTLEEVQMDENGLDENRILKKFEDEAIEAAKRVLKNSTSKTTSLPERSDSKQQQKENTDDIGDSVMKDADGGSEDGGLHGSSIDVEDVAKKELGLEDVHALVMSVPNLAQQLQNCKPLAESDDADDDSISAGPPSQTRATMISGRERGRGRARGAGRAGGRGRGIDSYLTPKKSEVEPEKRKATTTRNRRATSTRRQASIMVEDSDEDEGLRSPTREENEGDQSDGIEFVPVSSTRKRRATRSANASATRSSQRQKAESAVPSSSIATPSSGSRRSAFVSRARTRRNTATIDIDEESGDDAM